jgi:hypothetical protein
MIYNLHTDLKTVYYLATNFVYNIYNIILYVFIIILFNVYL